MQTSTSLDTKRLTLSPATASALEADIGGREVLADLLEYDVPLNWPTELLRDERPELLRQVAGRPGESVWRCWYWVLSKRPFGMPPVLIGHGGFEGPPDSDGLVEIEYALLPQFQGQGFAAEAVAAMLGWAFSKPDVQTVAAETLPEWIGSVKLLARLGFEPGDGAELHSSMRFEMSRDRFARYFGAS